jgi:hypothetical protein
VTPAVASSSAQLPSIIMKLTPPCLPLHAALSHAPQLMGCRGALAERDPGTVFATPARICQIPNHPE